MNETCIARSISNVWAGLWWSAAMGPSSSLGPCLALPISLSYTHTVLLIAALTHVTSHSTWQLLHIQHRLSDLDAGSSASGATLYSLSSSEEKREERRRAALTSPSLANSACLYLICLTMSTSGSSCCFCRCRADSYHPCINRTHTGPQNVVSLIKKPVVMEIFWLTAIC